MWLAILSDQLPVIALVGYYPTNKLIGRRLLPERLSPLQKIEDGWWMMEIFLSSILYSLSSDHRVLSPLSRSYSRFRGRFRRVTHPFATNHCSTVETPNSNIQIPTKFQNSKLKFQTNSEFQFVKFQTFGIWCLGIGIYLNIGAWDFHCEAMAVLLACVRHAASVHPEPGSNSQ